MGLVTTFRVVERERFTSVSRETIGDSSLSFRARGVLVWLLDKPDDWRADSSTIARAGKEGREAVRTALRELEDAGYLVRRKVQGDGGRWVTEVEVHERPVKSTDAQEPDPGFQLTDAQETDAREPDLRFAGRSTEELRLITETEGTHTSDLPGPSLDELFEEFWAACPKRTGKGEARKAYERALKRATPAAILAGMVRYAEETRGTEPRFLKTPGPWLNADRWLDEPGANVRQGAPRAGARQQVGEHEGPAGRVVDL